MSRFSAQADVPKSDVIIAKWLFVMCAMVFAMVVLGGVTRLTHSGLSMVNWHPISGWLPPMDDAAWMAEFENYKQFPEYQKINKGMDLAGFKAIFWFEFSHRLWGRLIGVAFLLPFLFFLVKGWVTRPLAPKLVFMFVLGGLQGVLGWFMVKSGLVDNPDVSQYRLTAHFSAAMLIYGYMFWVALGLLYPERHDFGISGADRLRGGAFIVVAWVALTLVSGGFVAGLDAGFLYNTFPLMEDRLIPVEAYELSPVYLNFFEHPVTVQFNHRTLAELLFVFVFLFWLRSRAFGLHERTRFVTNALMVMICIQVALGISTLLLVVPVTIAAAHQAGAVVLLTLALWTLHEFRHPD